MKELWITICPTATTGIEIHAIIQRKSNKEHEVPSCVGCMPRPRRPHKFSFSFLSHLIKHKMKCVGYDTFFIHDTVGNSPEKMEWLISRNKLEVDGRKLQFTSRSRYFPAGNELMYEKPERGQSVFRPSRELEMPGTEVRKVRFQAFATVQLRCLFFWEVAQRQLVVR